MVTVPDPEGVLSVFLQLVRIMASVIININDLFIIDAII
jgi:hypothetical protein